MCWETGRTLEVPGARLAHPPTGTKSYTPTPCTWRT
jgi:hypothetical protein